MPALDPEHPEHPEHPEDPEHPGAAWDRIGDFLAEPAGYDPASAAEVVVSDYESLALALRRARRHAKVSQRVLAARAGVAASTVARLELGTTDCGVRTLIRLLNGAGVHLAVTGLQPTTFPFGIVEDKRDARGRRPPPHRLSEAGLGYWDPSKAAAIRQAVSAHASDYSLLLGVAALRASRR